MLETHKQIGKIKQYLRKFLTQKEITPVVWSPYL